jgi:hypothetical protein
MRCAFRILSDSIWDAPGSEIAFQKALGGRFGVVWGEVGKLVWRAGRDSKAQYSFPIQKVRCRLYKSVCRPVKGTQLEIGGGGYGGSQPNQNLKGVSPSFNLAIQQRK